VFGVGDALCVSLHPIFHPRSAAPQTIAFCEPPRSCDCDSTVIPLRYSNIITMEKPSKDKTKKRAPSAAATTTGSAAAASSKKRAKTTIAEAASRVSTGATPLQPVKKQKQTTTGGNSKSSNSKNASTAKKQKTLDSFFKKAQPKAVAEDDNNSNKKKTDENQATTAPPAPASAAKKKPAPPSSSSNINKKQKTSNLKYIKTPYTAGDHLPEITEPQLMFDDMIHRIVKDNGSSPQQHERRTQLAALVQKLRNRPLRLATMCSGTESPLLALDMLQKSIQDACRDDPGLFGESNNTIETSSIFQLEHVFSCEIEPFKQAYIERNFHPPVLFRDIRELGNDQAYTAYGALVKVPNTPGCADLLIAGTSCVDYSNLNNTKVCACAVRCGVVSYNANEECFFFGCVAFGGCST